MTSNLNDCHESRRVLTKRKQGNVVLLDELFDERARGLRQPNRPMDTLLGSPGMDETTWNEVKYLISHHLPDQMREQFYSCDHNGVEQGVMAQLRRCQKMDDVIEQKHAFKHELSTQLRLAREEVERAHRRVASAMQPGSDPQRPTLHDLFTRITDASNRAAAITPESVTETLQGLGRLFATLKTETDKLNPPKVDHGWYTRVKDNPFLLEARGLAFNWAFGMLERLSNVLSHEGTMRLAAQRGMRLFSRSQDTLVS